jgi:hypothetical protein
MLTYSTSLKNVFKNDTTVRSTAGATIEYNMNSLIDNITVTSSITDTQYTDVISSWPTGKPNPFKKLFPLDSIIKPWRPLDSGINYYILPQNGTTFSFVSPKNIAYPSNIARVYYPGISTTYKYWVTPKNVNLDLSVNYVNSISTKPALANKIVITFDKFNTLPTSYNVVITKSDNSTITLNSISTPSDGKAVLYYNGTTFSSSIPTEPISYSTPILIKSINLTGTNPGGIIAVIEVSARWIKDISSDIVSFNIQKESSASDTDILPVGFVTANSLALELAKYNQSSLQIQEYNRLSTTFDSSITYLCKNIKIDPYFYVYHSNGSITNGSLKYDKVPQGTYYVDNWSVSEYGDATLNCLDGSKYLMDTLCPDILLENYPVTAILRVLLDRVGFSNYNFNIATDDKSVPAINYWWTNDTSTVWQAIQDLCRDIQMNAVFDDNNILQFYSRDYLYNKTDVDWSFNYDKEGNTLANIIDFSKHEIASANQVKILWSTPLTSNYVAGSTRLWDSPTTFLGAGGLKYPITAESSAADTILILDLTNIDSYNNFETLFNFNEYLLIDSEIIEFDAIQYQYVPKESGTNVPQTVWVESEADINKYRNLSKPGYVDYTKPESAYFKPTGAYRVKTRGALGTTPAYHSATSEDRLSQWSGLKVVWQ